MSDEDQKIEEIVKSMHCALMESLGTSINLSMNYKGYSLYLTLEDPGE